MKPAPAAGTGRQRASTTADHPITVDLAPQGLHPKSEMHDQANEAPGRLIIEWTAQL
jgi:hypothetical protein